MRQDAIATGPARKIYLAAAQQPDFGGAASLAAVQKLEIVPRYRVTLRAP